MWGLHQLDPLVLHFVKWITSQAFCAFLNERMRLLVQLQNKCHNSNKHKNRAYDVRKKKTDAITTPKALEAYTHDVILEIDQPNDGKTYYYAKT